MPNVLRSDGGPQFSAHYTKEFLKRWGVKHVVCSPHYPQANGHAESAVKLVKRLLQKTSVAGNTDCDEFARGLLEIRNTPRGDGRSPAQVLYGHPVRSAVPMHYRAFDQRWQRAAEDCDRKGEEMEAAAREAYNASAKPLRPLRIGAYVSLQDPDTGLWDRTGQVVGIGSHRSYLLKTPSGRTLWRNRRHVRPFRGIVTTRPDSNPRRGEVASPAPDPVSRKTVRFSLGESELSPRRSVRRRQPPERLQVDPKLKTYGPTRGEV